MFEIKKICKHEGFSLLELMIVVVIVGILASISLLSYSKAVRRAKLSEAKIALKQIWECNEMFYTEYGYYFGPAYDIGITGIPEIGFSPLSGDPKFVYSIEINSPPTYIAEPLLRRFGGDGSILDYEVQVDWEGRMYVFEPGMFLSNGKPRLRPTLGGSETRGAGGGVGTSGDDEEQGGGS